MYSYTAAPILNDRLHRAQVSSARVAEATPSRWTIRSAAKLYQLEPERQMVGSHFDEICDLHVQTVLPAVEENRGENDSEDPVIAVFALLPY